MGEPVQLGTVKEIEKEFRVGRRVLARLADIGVIERTRTNPAFWSSVRREAYLKGHSP